VSACIQPTVVAADALLSSSRIVRVQICSLGAFSLRWRKLDGKPS
jgi:hypothetical protein